MFTTLGAQLRKPSGLLGRIVAKTIISVLFLSAMVFNATTVFNFYLYVLNENSFLYF